MLQTALCFGSRFVWNFQHVLTAYLCHFIWCIPCCGSLFDGRASVQTCELKKKSCLTPTHEQTNSALSESSRFGRLLNSKKKDGLLRFFFNCHLWRNSRFQNWKNVHYNMMKDQPCVVMTPQEIEAPLSLPRWGRDCQQPLVESSPTTDSLRLASPCPQHCHRFSVLVFVAATQCKHRDRGAMIDQPVCRARAA